MTPNHGGTANYYTLAALHFFAGVFLPIGASTRSMMLSSCSGLTTFFEHLSSISSMDISMFVSVPSSTLRYQALVDCNLPSWVVEGLCPFCLTGPIVRSFA